jgi:cell division protein FtsB
MINSKQILMSKIKDFFYKIKNRVKYSTGIDFKKIIQNKIVEHVVMVLAVILLALIFSRFFAYKTLKDNDDLKNDISAMVVQKQNLEQENEQLRNLLESCHNIAGLNNKLYNECADLFNEQTNSSMLKKSELPDLPDFK